MANGDSGAIGLSFLIFLSLTTAVCAAVVGCFIYQMVRHGQHDHDHRHHDGTHIAIWTLCLIFIACVIILGWLWLCCGCGFALGIAFTVLAGLGMVFFIVLLAIGTSSMDVAIGAVGMIFCLAMVVLGALALACGGVGGGM